MTTKKEKLNAQQGFNQFLFETMMDRIRGAELLGQDIQKLQGQINSLKVSDAATIGSFKSLFPRVEKLEGQLNFKLNDGPIANHSKRIADLEKTVEALSETVDQLSTCKCEAGAGMLKRITELERQNTNALEAHRIRGLQISIILKRLEEREVDVEQLQISRGAEMLYENEANKRLEGLENRLSRAQDMIAEMHKEGFIPVKQPQRKRVQSP